MLLLPKQVSCLKCVVCGDNCDNDLQVKTCQSNQNRCLTTTGYNEGAGDYNANDVENYPIPLVLKCATEEECQDNNDDDRCDHTRDDYYCTKCCQGDYCNDVADDDYYYFGGEDFFDIAHYYSTTPWLAIILGIVLVLIISVAIYCCIRNYYIKQAKMYRQIIT